MQTSPHFTPIRLSEYNLRSCDLSAADCTEATAALKDRILCGENTLWGIPFIFGSASGPNLIHIKDGNIDLGFKPEYARYLIFVHFADMLAPVPESDGIIRNFRGVSPLGARICEYVVRYADGGRESFPIRNRIEINCPDPRWGEGAFAAVPQSRFKSVETVTGSIYRGEAPSISWGQSQTRVNQGRLHPSHWLYAWENPRPDSEICGVEIRDVTGNLFLLGVTAGAVKAHPLRYGRRRKAIVRLDGAEKNPQEMTDVDLGQIISVVPRPLYDNDNWEAGYNNQQPKQGGNEYIVEYAAHDEARLYLGSERTPVPVGELSGPGSPEILPAEQPVTLRVLGPDGKPVPVKVHAHGIGGEYLPPRNRHRLPNPYWFEDYSVDFVHGPHWCTYIDGTAEYLLPLGEVYFEVSKGFEIKPVRVRFEITPDTAEIEIRLENILDWRSRGWVTADTHVHFLSPHSALLEGEAEGVNVVNLLASQWGELFTNVGDFDGKSFVSTGEDYMVRVGTENRQQILGHISLLGYEGAMILPLTTAGPDEAALGDPVEITLTQWAKKCREQLGVNILPHFPNPRGEHSAAIASDLIDGVEMTSWGDLYSGISPYSLSDWYRYLNCGYHLAAVGGTDKMSANTAVGTVRTYAQIDGVFNFDSWKAAVRAGRTFATYGALVDINVEGRRPGERIELNGAATLQVQWSVASVTIPITAVELVVGGDTADTARFDGVIGAREGFFSFKADRATWIALRIRGCQKDKPEIIIAHSSAVMVHMNGAQPMDRADAVSILEQIEGATAYITTIGTKADERRYKAALSAMTSAHRALHNKMHEMGCYHNHTVVDDHHK